LQKLAKRKAAYDAEEARWLRLGQRASLHLKLGYGSYFEYVERVFGYTPKVAAERLRVAGALDALPRTRQALHEGELHWSTARELTRVATADTETHWLEAAENKTVRQIERLVSGRRPGDLPTDAADESARGHTLHLEVEAQTLALYRDAVATLTRDAGQHLSDDQVVNLMARKILASTAEDAVAGESEDQGRSNYQIAVTVCERCGCGEQDAGGEAYPLTNEAMEMARCDAQVVNLTHVDPHVGRPKEAQVDPQDLMKWHLDLRPESTRARC